MRPAVRALEADEQRSRPAGPSARYRRFAADVRTQPRRPRATCSSSCAAEGSRVAGYGAPAKGNTLLNYCAIDTRLLAFTVDKNPLKVGLFTPGMHIPVRDVATLLGSGSPTTC